MHPINKHRNQIVKEDIKEQFVNLVNKKGNVIKREIEYEKRTQDLKTITPSKTILDGLLQRINITEDINKLASLNRELLKYINPNYQYIRTIGKGGEASVVLIKDVLDCLSILKIAKPQITQKKRGAIWNFSLANFKRESTDQSIKKRFIRGAKLQRQLSGATEYGYIPQVYNIIEHPLCIQMEYSRASRLLKYLEDKDLMHSLSIFLNLLVFVNEIHCFGIIHRDIKPDNILINEQGIPVLLDFTTAKELTNEDNLTAVGYQIGTRLWCSPKQMTDAGRSTFQDDIYSLGLLLYVFILKRIPQPITKYDARKNEMIAIEDLRTDKGKNIFINRLETELPDNWKGIFKNATNLYEGNRYQVLEDFITDVQKQLESRGATIQKNVNVDRSTTVQGTSKQYEDLVNRLKNLEDIVYTIINVMKGIDNENK